MKIIAVDPNPVELLRLSVKLRGITPPGTSVECFSDPLYAYQYSFHHRIDALFAAAQMSRLSGLELAERIRARFPGARIFVLWPDGTFRQEALRRGADGYLLSPASAEALREAMEQAEAPDDGAGPSPEREAPISQKKIV